MLLLLLKVRLKVYKAWHENRTQLTLEVVYCYKWLALQCCKLLLSRIYDETRSREGIKFTINFQWRQLFSKYDIFLGRYAFIWSDVGRKDLLPQLNASIRLRQNLNKILHTVVYTKDLSSAIFRKKKVIGVLISTGWANCLQIWYKHNMYWYKTDQIIKLRFWWKIGLLHMHNMCNTLMSCGTLWRCLVEVEFCTVTCYKVLQNCYLLGLLTMSLHSSEQYPEVQILSDGVPKITLMCAEQTYLRQSLWSQS